MNQAVINTNKLSKVYGNGKDAIYALADLDLTVHKGEIFGYLGPNGAGKTTTIRLLLDFIRPTTGHASVLGLDARQDSIAIHQQVGFMPGELNLWKNRTSKQIVQFVASVRGNKETQIRHANALAERLKLDMNKKVRDYSTGNKRKLGLVLALMHQPQLLILDEPTSGLDPLMQQTFNEMMREIQAEGRTVFLSSHMLSEVQAICDRVAILRDGKLRAVESVEHLMHVGYRHVSITLDNTIPAHVSQELNDLDIVHEVTLADHTIDLKLSGDFDPILRILSDSYVKDINVKDASLEDIFLTFYGGTTTVNRHNQNHKQADHAVMEVK